MPPDNVLMRIPGLYVTNWKGAAEYFVKWHFQDKRTMESFDHLPNSDDCIFTIKYGTHTYRVTYERQWHTGDPGYYYITTYTPPPKKRTTRRKR